LLTFCSFNVNGTPLKISRYILFSLLAFSPLILQAQEQPQTLTFDYFGEPVKLQTGRSLSIDFEAPLSERSLRLFNETLSSSDYQPLVQALLDFKEQKQLDDWLYYQLIRKTAGTLSPKADNYYRYTLYKWFLLTRSGYAATLKIGGDKLLFYVRSDDNIYNIPYYTRDGQQYVCLNYHDYGSNIDFGIEKFTEVSLPAPANGKPFSYKITRLPDFKAAAYEEKDIRFSYYQDDYRFTIKLNPQVKTIFANYPVVDYASYFNIPLSDETYSSLIPLLKKNISHMTVKGGVDYLMHFTRYAFLFKTDAENFGSEKRLTPEQTLLYPESDCEDRAALFFYLVKELYNLPMIVLAYPQHVTIAVKFDKPVGKPIIYNGEKYSVCEPTPQKTDLEIGRLLPSLRHQSFEVAYSYLPGQH